MHPRPVVAVLLALVLAMLLGLTGCAPVPGVDELVSNYIRNQSDFARLVELPSPDAQFEFKLHEYGLSGQGFDPADVEEYASILKAVGAERLSASGDGLDVVLGDTGIVSSGFRWGYIHTPEPPSETVPLEVARDPGERELWYYPVGDDWYAYWQSW